MTLQNDFLVVGIGASAGGSEALQGFFRSMPANSGMAFIVMTHQSRDHASALPQILGRHTLLPVVSAADEMTFEPNKVYVCPPDNVMTLKSGRLKLQHASGDRNPRPIDVFLTSLAKDRGESAIGILLSGAGSDGTLGMKSIKEEGGLTLAQGSDGHGPAQRSMPDTAVAAGVVDLVLPVEQMAERLVRFARDHRKARPAADAGSDRDNVYGAIYRLLLNQVGHDFSGYKSKSFARRVARRLQVLELSTIEAYVDRLRQSPDEVNLLFRDLLIGVTSFFRDPAAFDVLAKTVIPKLFEDRGARESIRIWVPGCSTGEEVYSLAILIREYMDSLPAAPKVQLFATDIDEKALAVARAGRYPAALLENISQPRLKRFLTGDEISCTINKEVRDLCVFSTHSVVRDPPFSRIDLISCRDLLIYFGSEFQSRVVPAFHFALKPQGYLFLGTSENIGAHSDLFTPIDQKHRIFQRRDHVVDHPLLSNVISNGGRAVELHDSGEQHGSAAANLRRVVEARVMERFAPAHVVVNRGGDIIHYSVRTGKYLEPAAGLPDRQIMSMARRGLRIDLHAALREAIETRRTAIRQRIPVETENRIQLVDITVEPLGDHKADPLFLVLFSDMGQPPEMVDSEGPVTGDRTVDLLERELGDTREPLQATIEQYETAVEELKSSNEELLSMNEELQSTNEELQTSKEELQSVNEELHTVNLELNSKVDEIDRANSDLRNLFESTQIATIFLDSKLIIRGFTPAVVGIFNLISSDRGRPLTNIAGHLEDEGDLRRDMLTVLEHGRLIERRVRLLDGTAHYLMRILPYRGRNDVIDGVLVTFVDVTKLAEAESQQRVLIEELNHRVRNMLAVIGAIASQTVATTPSPERFKEVFLGRLYSMASSYGLISQERWGPISLEAILETELSAYKSDKDKIQMVGPPIWFHPPQALALGLIIHELATNATKYGSLKGSKGRVAISWNIADDGLTLTWQESGGPPVKKQKHQGFGTTLVKGQVDQVLSGSVAMSFAAKGLRARIKIPVSQFAASDEAGRD